MVRALISLSKEDKHWLENYGARRRQSFAETVRTAIRQFRKQQKTQDCRSILTQTAGLWRGRKVDGLKYVQKIRSEWGQ